MYIEYIVMVLFYVFILLVPIIIGGIIKKEKVVLRYALVILSIIIIVVSIGYTYELLGNSSKGLYKKVLVLNEDFPYDYNYDIFAKFERSAKDPRVLYYGGVIDAITISYLKRAIRLDESFDEARIELASVYLRRKKFRKVLEQLTRLNENKKEDTKALAMKGIAYAELGEWEDALQMYKYIYEKGEDDFALKKLIKERERPESDAEFFLFEFDGLEIQD